MDGVIMQATGVKVTSMHHDISTVTGDEVLAFELAKSPNVRDLKR